MTTQISILSGLGRKSPAAILIDHHGYRILLDAGGPLDVDETCDWYVNIHPDVILLTHDHVDHINGVQWFSDETPLYCTSTVAKSLPKGRAWHQLPSRGKINLNGISVTTGLAGHSLDGIWLHLSIGGGIFYSGDFSFESLIFPFTPPPKADIALLDASYGLYDRTQSDCRKALFDQLNQSSLLPVPPSGRAFELAMCCQSLEIPWTFDPECSTYFNMMSKLPKQLFKSDCVDQLASLTPLPWETNDAKFQGLIRLAGNADGCGGEAGKLINDPYYLGQVIYTGYMPSKARQDVQMGRGKWFRWNVHPRTHCIHSLAEMLGANTVVPLFCLIDTEGWKGALGNRFYSSALITL